MQIDDSSILFYYCCSFIAINQFKNLLISAVFFGTDEGEISIKSE